jgi:hypothetical protein
MSPSFAGAFLISEYSDRILCHIPLHHPSCAANPIKAVIQKQDSITVFLVAYSSKKYTESNFAGQIRMENSIVAVRK